jgi:hypothetical protein
VFWETLPAQYLPLALWLEADRMATLRVDREAFDREREVVKEERACGSRTSRTAGSRDHLRARVHDAPVQARADWQHGRPAVGLDRDVREFHNTYYVPENATRHHRRRLRTRRRTQLVTQYSAACRRRPNRCPRDIPRSRRRQGRARFTVEEAWPLPAVVVAYHITYDGHAGLVSAAHPSKILSDGRQCRIPRELVYKKRIALTRLGSGNIIEDPNLFYGVAIVQPADAGRRRRRR